MSSDPETRQSTALLQASHLLGRWAGSGQFRSATGWQYFTQSETVSRQLEGELLTIEGTGYDRDDPSRRIHAAFGLISYDAERESYQWRAYSGGHWTETELHLHARGFSWTLDPAPGGVVRYTAVIDGDIWEEFGETSQNGEPWSTLMSMRLHRQP